MKIVDKKLLDDLCAAASAHPRGRINHNLHEDYREPCQRLLNAVEPTSYIRPHRHLTPPKPETFLVLRGRFAAVTFNEDGGIEGIAFLAHAEGTVAADISPGTWHTVLSLSPGSIFFETKPGPYEPISDKDWAPWAPPEGSPEAEVYLRSLRQRVLEGIPTR